MDWEKIFADGGGDTSKYNIKNIDSKMFQAGGYRFLTLDQTRDPANDWRKEILRIVPKLAENGVNLKYNISNLMRNHEANSDEFRKIVFDQVNNVNTLSVINRQANPNITGMNFYKNYLQSQGGYISAVHMNDFICDYYLLIIYDAIKDHFIDRKMPVDNILVGFMLSLPRHSIKTRKSYLTTFGDFTFSLASNEKNGLPGGRMPRLFFLYLARVLKDSRSSGAMSYNKYKQKENFSDRDSLTGSEGLVELWKKIYNINIGTDLGFHLEQLGFRDDNKNRKSHRQFLKALEATKLRFCSTNIDDLPFDSTLLRRTIRVTRSPVFERFGYMVGDFETKILESDRDLGIEKNSKHSIKLSLYFLHLMLISNYFYVDYEVIKKLTNTYSIDLMILASYYFSKLKKRCNSKIEWEEMCRWNGHGLEKHHYKSKIKSAHEQLLKVWKYASRIKIDGEGIIFSYVNEYSDKAPLKENTPKEMFRTPFLRPWG